MNVIDVNWLSLKAWEGRIIRGQKSKIQELWCLEQYNVSGQEAEGDLPIFYTFVFWASVYYIISIHIGKGYLPNPVDQLEDSLLETLTSTHKRNISPGTWAILDPVKLTYKINHHTS